MHTMTLHNIDDLALTICTVRNFSYTIQLPVYILMMIGFDMNPLVVYPSTHTCTTLIYALNRC